MGDQVLAEDTRLRLCAFNRGIVLPTSAGVFELGERSGLDYDRPEVPEAEERKIRKADERASYHWRGIRPPD